MKRDLLLRFFEADLYRARWSETIQQEWLQHAKEQYPAKSQNLDRTDNLMRKHFQSAWVEAEEFDKFIELVELPDQDDRHVVACAVACNASYIVTDNTKDFPQKELARFGIEVGTADKFLAGTFDHYLNDGLHVLRDHRANLGSQPSPAEYLMMLRSRELPLLSSRLQPIKDLL